MVSMNAYSPVVLDSVKELLDISISLSAEKNYEKLLEKILRESRRITRCNAGTLYLVEDGKLVFKIVQNDQLVLYGFGQEKKLDLLPLDICDSTVAGHCVLTKEIINIPDVYSASGLGFDFTGPRQYDAITGYKTQSMLAVPLENHDGRVIGVLQLLNAKDIRKNIVPFSKHIEPVIQGIASQAAVAISNMRYAEDLDQMLQSFARVVASAIDARSPYNANHTRRVVALIKAFSQYLQSQSNNIGFALSDDDIKQLILAAWFHDIGKIAIPSELMNKSTRLGSAYEKVKLRFLNIRAQRKYELMNKAVFASDELEKEEGKQTLLDKLALIDKEMNEDMEFIAMVNRADYPTNDECKNRIGELASRRWLNADGFEEPWLTQSEVEALTLPSGTLTKQEREAVERHVLVAKRMLEQVSFGQNYAAVPRWACAHHEFLDGSGYPQKLTAENLPMPVRILTIMDIFEALTAEDRPYHKALSPEEAFSVMKEMGRIGKIDQQLLGIFEESRVWA